MHFLIRWSTVAVLMSCLGLVAPAAWGVDVSGDDAGDRYVGSGGILLPASAPRETRQAVSRCPDCQWRITAPCVNSPDEGAQAAFGDCVSVDAAGLSIPPKARPLTRMIARAFDAYDQARAQHSAAI